MSEVQFPYISVPVSTPKPATLPTNTDLVATVQNVGPESRVVLNVGGTLLEAVLPYLLEAGQELSVRVRPTTGGTLILDVVPPQNISGSLLSEAKIGDLLESLGVPRNKETEQVVRDFLKHRAPLERDVLLKAVESARGEPQRSDTAAFLAAAGVDPQSEPVELLVRFLSASTQDEPTGTPTLLRPFAQPGDIQSALRSSAGTSPLVELDRTVGRHLDGNPALARLDAALSLLERASATAERLSPLETARRVTALLTQLRGGSPTTEPPRESPDVLREVRALLLDEERREIVRDSALGDARTARSALADQIDRTYASRLLNQLLSHQEIPSAVLNIPMREEGRVFQLPVRIERRDGGRGGTKGGSPSLNLEADFTRLGRVRARIDARGSALAIRISTRDAGTQHHLERNLNELREALRTSGYEPTLLVESTRRPETSLLAPPSADSPYTRVNLEA